MVYDKKYVKSKDEKQSQTNPNAEGPDYSGNPISSLSVLGISMAKKMQNEANVKMDSLRHAFTHLSFRVSTDKIMQNEPICKYRQHISCICNFTYLHIYTLTHLLVQSAKTNPISKIPILLGDTFQIFNSGSSRASLAFSTERSRMGSRGISPKTMEKNKANFQKEIIW